MILSEKSATFRDHALAAEPIPIGRKGGAGGQGFSLIYAPRDRPRHDDRGRAADGGEVELAAQAVVERWKRIDVLINNAGIVRDAQLVKWNGGGPESVMSEELWDSVIDVNLKGVFLTTRAVVPHMIKGGGGVVLSAASVVAILGNFGQTNYVASKAGIIGMTRTWARELGKYKIRVNAVAPGFIATDMVRAMPVRVLRAMVARTPLGRVGTPEDVANTYVWLASDQASFIHGAVISVDGGVVLGT